MNNDNINYRYTDKNKLNNIVKCKEEINKEEINNDNFFLKEKQSIILKTNSDDCDNIIIKKFKKEKKLIEKEIFFFKLTNKLIEQYICPNFVYMYDFSLDKNIIYGEITDGNFLDFLKINKNKNKDKIFKSALFQILIGILVLQKKIKTFHSDLHIKNIFYKKINPKIKYFEYIINGISYIIPTFGYLFIIANFGHAQTLLETKYNSLNKDDINFGIDYNYDFEHISKFYNKILKENLLIIIKNIDELKSYVNLDNQNFKNIVETFKNKYKNKQLFNLILFYCIENNLLNWKDFISQFTFDQPSDNIKDLIDKIFISKEPIENIIKEYFQEFYSQNINNKDKIITFNIIFKNIFPLSRNNNNNIIQDIKKLYSVEKFNYNTSKYFYLNTENNFLPKYIEPMFLNIKPYDYIKPIINLNINYNNEYYSELIEKYNYENNKRLDLYLDFDKIDLDEIMLQYIKNMPNCFVITLWPIYSDFIDETIKYLENYGNIYYKKIINFEPRGLINYLCSVYDEFKNKDILKIALDKFEWIRLPNSKSNKIAIIIFDNIKNLKLSGQSSYFKNTIRNWALNQLKKNSIDITNIRGNDLIHINDYFYQSIEYSELLLNSNSIGLLNNRLYENIYNDFYNISFLKIETVRKNLYTNISLETMNSIFLMGGAILYFYGIRQLEDVDVICINNNKNFLNNEDKNSKNIKKIIDIFCNESSKIFYIDVGITNTNYWRESWELKNNNISDYFNINKFNNICWNPRYHCNYKGMKSYLIEFEFYRKISRTNEKIIKNSLATLSKDYTDYIMINYINPKIINKFIYLNSQKKLTLVDNLIKLFPNLKKLPFNNKILEFIIGFLKTKYEVFLDKNIDTDYIKSLFYTII